MHKTTFATLVAAPALVLGLTACTSSPGSADYDRITAEVVKASFQDRGIAKVDRLVQDEANRLCSAADAAVRIVFWPLITMKGKSGRASFIEGSRSKIDVSPR